jgi:formylglycine-generating enzyme required for sulfatase activity
MAVRYVAAALITALLFAGGMSAARAEVNEDAVAVVIGNSNYSGDRIPNVDYAHRDAAAFRRYLIDVQGYREGNIIDLRDATQAQMEAALGNDRTHEGTLWQYVRTEGSDVTVYYSGHGVPGLKSKRGYLLPVDADPNKPEINGYPVDTLYANLAKLPARSVTVYLDACFSGNSPRGMLIKATSGITVVPKLPKKKTKLTILTAASGDQVASWDTENHHGLFTEHLLAALYGAADAPRYGVADGKVTLGEVEKYLARNMSYAAKRIYGRIQHATINGDAGVVLAALGKSRPERPLIRKLGRFDAKSSPAILLEPIEDTYVALRNANVRAAPDVNASRVTTLPKGSKVHVAAKVASKDWLAVDRGGKRLGYVYSKLLQDSEAYEAAEVEVGRRHEEEKQKKLAAAKAVRLEVARREEEAAKKRVENDRERKRRQSTAAVIPPKVPASDAVKDAVGVYMSRGRVFQDCAECPEMVVIPPGNFRMGDLSGNSGVDERPVHDVWINYRFAVGKFEVTEVQWNACLVDGRCRGIRPFGYGKFDPNSTRPVVNVTWKNVEMFLEWLRWKTSEDYRLLSEAEFEYVARAGTTTRYWWGDNFGNEAEATMIRRKVGQFQSNSFGVHDVHGGVWEWVQDCWHENYLGAPTDGSSWTGGADCSHRVLRGGSWGNSPRNRRSVSLFRFRTAFKDRGVGFRVARTLSR